MKKKHPPFNIDSLLKRAYESFCDSLKDTSAYSIFIEQTKKNISKNKNLPNVKLPLILFLPPNKTPREIIYKDFSLISQKYAVLSLLTQFEEFILGAQTTLMIFNLAVENNKKISLGQIQEMQKKCFEAAKKKNPWWTLNELLKKNKIDLKYRDSYFTLINLRNFLAHRKGTVGDFDIKLEFIWYRPNIYLGKNLIKDQPIYLKDNESLHLKERKIKKTFSPGQQVSLTLRDCVDITWTLYQFATELTQKINEYISNHLKKV